MLAAGPAVYRAGGDLLPTYRRRYWPICHAQGALTAHYRQHRADRGLGLRTPETSELPCASVDPSPGSLIHSSTTGSELASGRPGRPAKRLNCDERLDGDPCVPIPRTGLRSISPRLPIPTGVNTTVSELSLAVSRKRSQIQPVIHRTKTAPRHGWKNHICLFPRHRQSSFAGTQAVFSPTPDLTTALPNAL